MSTKIYADINLYDLLCISHDADQPEIRKAYRKKALQCHPDKNPDNPKAAQLFLELSKALELLTDKSARAAYDKVLKSKKATELRNQSIDIKRQKLQADLEQREQDAQHKLYNVQPYTVHKTDEEILQEQILRLRREGSKLLEEEQKLMREQLQKAMSNSKRDSTFDSSKHRIKIKWHANKNDPTNGGYTEENILQYLKKYGDIVAFAMSKKRGAAMVEFKTLEASEMALAYEKGILENPLKLDWLVQPQQNNGRNVTTSASDFEDLVLRKLRQAEERKRLIEEIKKEDEVEEHK